jgi:hypothetical protein
MTGPAWASAASAALNVARRVTIVGSEVKVSLVTVPQFTSN